MTRSSLFSLAFFVVALAGFGWLPVAMAQEQAEPEVAAPMEYVARTVSIMVDESIENLEEKVEQAVHDPNCMLETFGPEAEDNWWPWVHIEPLESAGPHARLIRIIVPLRFHDDDEDDEDFDEHRNDDEDEDEDDDEGDFDDEAMSIDPDKAERLLELVVDNIRKRLQQSHRFRAKMLDREFEQVEKAFAQAGQDVETLFNKRRELLAESTDIGIGSEALLERIQHMGGQQQDLELELLGATARRKAIEQQIVSSQERARQSVAEDPVAAELAKIVGLRKQRIESIRALAEGGRAPTAKVHDAEMALAEATARLLEQRQNAHRRAGGEIIADFTHELQRLAIESAGMEARLAGVNAQLQHAKGALDKSDEFDLVRRLLPEAKEVYEHALRAKHELGRARESVRKPKVEVLDD